MKTFSKYFLVLTFLFSSITFADEIKRIDAGSRRLTEKEKKEAQAIEKNEPKSVSKKSIVGISNNLPPFVFDEYIHNIIGISPLGDYLILEDESQWTINSDYQGEVFSWRQSDPIIIELNDHFISNHLYGYKYKMINTKTNTSIDVKLHLGPILTNPCTLQVIAINPITYEVILSDNSVWQCDPYQYYLFDRWLIGDGIIVGTNVKGWFNSSYDNILINVNLLEEIRSNRVE